MKLTLDQHIGVRIPGGQPIHRPFLSVAESSPTKNPFQIGNFSPPIPSNRVGDSLGRFVFGNSTNP